jgi:subtilase family serine protease
MFDVNGVTGEPCRPAKQRRQEEPPSMFVRVSLLAAVAALSLAGAASAAGSRDLGRAPASTTVRVAIVLNYQHEAELDTLVDGQADPGSPLYHHFLRPENFREYFAPTAAEYARVVSTLRSGGFAITHTFANRTVVDAAAPAPVAARFFSTDIHRVLSADAGNTYANVTVPIVPAQIRNLVLAVVGLDAAHRVHPQYRFSALAHRIARVPNARKAGAIFGPDGGYGPQAYINAYDFPSGSGSVGTGRASGVATDSDFLDGDLSSFLSYFGINRTGPATQRVLVDGGPPPGLDDDSVETTLDVEQIVSLAPGTALYVYEAPLDEPTNGNFIDIYNQVVQDDIVDTLNSSYTYCETAIDQVIHGYTRSVEHVEKQGSAEGITFHSAAGDSGSNSPGCNGVSVGEPVDTPHNIAVGGTTLSVNGQGQETGEVGWSYGTGGGVSTIFKVPSFQKRVSTIVAGGRNIPDLAFNADPGTGGSFFFGGGWAGPIGGTSMASPIFGAAMTAIDQLQNARAGHFNVALYKTWLAKGYGSGSGLLFRDITDGTIPPFGAGPGYDQMTGIGTMQVTNFAAALKH